MWVIKLKLQFKYIIKFQEGINNKTLANWIEIIYLQLYKDTHLIFVQAYETLQGIKYHFKKYKIEKCTLKI